MPSSEEFGKLVELAVELVRWDDAVQAYEFGKGGSLSFVDRHREAKETLRSALQRAGIKIEPVDLEVHGVEGI